MNPIESHQRLAEARARNIVRLMDVMGITPWTGASTTVDQWFAWSPVRLGALGTGRWAWFRKVTRIKTGPVTIYNERDAAL